jgi:hypothetical protein
MRSALAALALLALAAAGQAHAMPDRLAFTVIRDGDAIGSHVLTFATRGEETRVSIRTDVAVKLLFVTAYRFEHEGHEVWRNGRLVAYTSHTNDDGETKSLRVEPNGSDLKIDGSAARYLADAGIVPASLWNRRIVEQTRLMNTLDGTQMAVRVQDAGMDTVAVGGRRLPARHYVISGDLSREIWFDAEGVLSRVRFNGPDGSLIEYRRQ